VETAYPASYAQESFVTSDTSAINVPAIVRLTPPLDLDRIYHVLDTLVMRHGALRTVLTTRPGEPVTQRVAPTGQLNLERFEHDGDPHVLLPSILLAGSEQPFVVVDADLARAELHSLGPDRHILIIWWHHAISDLLSSQVLSYEIERLWRNETLAPLTCQMADYAVQERALRPTPEQWAFWTRALDPVQLGVPVARGPEHLMTRPALPGLGRHIVGSLTQLAAAGRTTMTAVLAAAVAASHAGAATSDRLLIGLTISNRDHPQWRSVVGCLADQLPLVVDTAGDPTFRELLRRVREALLDAYDHRLPLGLLLPLLRRQAPVFEVNLNFLPPSTKAARDPQPGGQPALPYGIAKTRPDPWWLGDAVLAYRPRIDHGALAGEIEGDGHIHGAGVVGRYGERFGALLARVAETPDLAISKLTLDE
jgi:iturin family lipopeptide synthetase A